jgi:DNA-binding LacI/PurR family transcriptional regulator
LIVQTSPPASSKEIGMAGLPTVDDVAQRAGVSRQTVSNVLNSPAIVRPETRERVQNAIAELGYRPHASARRLRTRASGTIGVRLDPMSGNGVSGSVLDRFLHELTQRADDRGMRITLFTAADDATEIEQYRRLRDGADIDAVVLTGTSYDDPRIAWLVREGMPYVAFGRPWGSESIDDPARPWVDVDGSAGTRAATEHLAGRGLRRIGWLGWPEGSGTGDDRRSGWAAAMTDVFGATPDELTAHAWTAEENVAPARRVVEELLAGHLADGHDAPPLDALVCASDSLALGAMMAVREAGFPKFPVIGFDNTPVAKAVGLSSVDQRLDEVAADALDLLLGPTGSRVLPVGADTGEPRHRLVDPRLVVRRSSHLAPVDEDHPTGTTAPAFEGRKETP